ncbi:hypothetical protein CDAR_286351 [Caerostris darwini]|uniref:Secreted protein n=1 Tax=Caerostris darwini TaxID=1538125 RepID=A0AAV4W2A4_9ARAC|nr:hypothetical protein CDAR_286351 [Caerostris darwini]
MAETALPTIFRCFCLGFLFRLGVVGVEPGYLFPIVRKHSATTSTTDRGVSNCRDPWGLTSTDVSGVSFGHSEGSLARETPVFVYVVTVMVTIPIKIIHLVF